MEKVLFLTLAEIIEIHNDQIQHQKDSGQAGMTSTQKPKES